MNLPTQGVQPGKYLLDPDDHEVAYLVDPGIGGRIREIDGRPITKLDSPKATIMALVTDGILTQKLPWGLVLIGVCPHDRDRDHGTPVAPDRGGRLSADLHLGLDVRRRGGPLAGGAPHAHQRRVARRGGVGPGVLFSSGLIAGGAIAGITIAGIAATLVSRADAAGVPAADYLAHVVGLQERLGAVSPERSRRRRHLRRPRVSAVPRREPLRCRRTSPVSPAISARIIHAALVLGVLTFWLVGWYIGQSAAVPAEALPDRRVLYVALALVSATLFGGAMFTAARLGPIRPGGSQDDWWHENLGKAIVVWALVEAPSLLGLVAYMLDPGLPHPDRDLHRTAASSGATGRVV